MQVPVRVAPLQAPALTQFLPMAAQSLHQMADPPLELMCSITSALRLYPQTSTAPGLNPYHIALTDVTYSSAALQGHVARAAEGESSPQLQQAMVYDTISWPMIQSEMMHNWDLYERYAGDELGALPRHVVRWNSQIDQGYRQAANAVQRAIGPQDFRALVPTVWAPAGMNRF